MLVEGGKGGKREREIEEGQYLSCKGPGTPSEGSERTEGGTACGRSSGGQRRRKGRRRRRSGSRGVS